MINELIFNEENVLNKNIIYSFNELYLKRPCYANNGGLHYYAMYSFWYILNMIKPEYVIESGVWKGCTTWIIDSIDSVKKIICIDPIFEVEPDTLSYVSTKAEYQSFRKCQDFLNQNFDDVDKDKTLIMFDDHIDVLPRLLHCKKIGIKHIFFDDNYKEMSHKTLWYYQNLTNNEDFKKIEIIKEINFNELPKDIYLLNGPDENLINTYQQYENFITNNLTYINIK